MLSSKMNKAKIKGQSPYQAQGSIAPQGVPQQPQGPDMRGLFAQQFERPEMTMSDKLGLLSGMMQDYSGVLGNDNADRARSRYDQRVGQEREDFEGNRNQQLMMAAAGGDPFALGMLDPTGQQAFRYGQERDNKLDDRAERQYGDQRADRADDVGFRDRQFDQGVSEGNRNYGLQREQFGFQQGADARDFEEGTRRWDSEFGLQQAEFDLLASKPPPVNEAFLGEVAKRDAQAFSDISQVGRDAAQNRITLAQLNSTMQNVPGGFQAVFQKALGDMGIETAGLSDIQAANALLAKLVPAQREAGSGPMSDKDLEMFRQSLPRMIQSVEGRQKIMQNMMEINDYIIAEGQVADAVLNGTISPAEGRAYMAEFGNPLEGIADASGGAGNSASGLQVGSIHDGFEYIGGDPNSRESWVKPSANNVPHMIGGR